MAHSRTLGFSTVQVLQAIASGYVYGFDIMDATGLPSGTVYPALGKLEVSGFVTSRWEDPRVARREKRPARKSYEITGLGREVLDATVREYQKLQRLALGKATS